MTPKRLPLSCILLFTSATAASDRQVFSITIWERGRQATAPRKILIDKGKGRERYETEAIVDDPCWKRATKGRNALSSSKESRR